MSDFDKLINRLESLLDRIEPLFPKQPLAATNFSGGAFRWCRYGKNGVVEPIEISSTIALDDLLCIDKQKTNINQNTKQFLARLPANHVLLWGPKGTGKSSLIKAILNEHKKAGLNLIEVERNDLVYLKEIIDSLRKLDDRFILFCDDLSFEADDLAYKAIKVALDGSLSAPPENILIYATSNRRHLMPESMQDNRDSHFVQDELHMSEAIEEKISLSERFGICLSFHPFNQDQYLSIVRYWLKKIGITKQIDAFVEKAALKWALERGSRSGRVAFQFAKDWSGKAGLNND